MNQSEKRIAIAEACGWTEIISTPNDPMPPKGREYKESNWGKPIPDYFNDLNAMHEAVTSKPFSVRRAFCLELQRAMSANIGATIHISECIHATAAQRAEAFGLTLNLWK